MELSRSRGRSILISPWLGVIVLFGALSSVVFIVAAVQAEDVLARIVAAAAIVTLFGVFCNLTGDAILLLDRRGFRTLFQRRTPWEAVTAIRVAEVPEWGIETTAVVLDVVRGDHLQQRVLKGFGRLGHLVDLEGLRDRLEAARAEALGGASGTATH
ncbi:hypothetical protein [Propioniciclava soli]|uniref:PH domain-containing protein n=1 Tax=Propioniciclava soli TaxID=2775081 RepID=A0ABZ3C720_9ACTN|nr:hypothetical protein [Propioniciclava soli]